MLNKFINVVNIHDAACSSRSKTCNSQQFGFEKLSPESNKIKNIILSKIDDALKLCVSVRLPSSMTLKST